jgi:hypothetical protein
LALSHTWEASSLIEQYSEVPNGVFLIGENDTIRRNYFSGNHWRTNTGGGQICVATIGMNGSILIEDNVIDAGGGNLTSGIELGNTEYEPLSNSVIRNNIVGNQQLYGIIEQFGGGNTIDGNVVYNSGAASPGNGFLDVPGIDVKAGICGSRYTRNCAFDNQTTKTQYWGFYIGAGASNDYMIADNLFIGNINRPGFCDGGTGTNKRIEGNLSAAIGKPLAESPAKRAPAFEIGNWGPRSTNAGNPFNVQPSGLSAMYFVVHDPPPHAAVLWQGKALPGVAVDTKAGLITVTVPGKCFAVPGEYEIVIKDLETGATSQVVQFQVK